LKEDAKNSTKKERWVYAAIPLGLILLFTIFWPLRNIALVFWVRGSAAYEEGVRVVRGKPTQFSDGQIVPNFSDFVTGMVAFFVAMFTAIAISWIIHRVL